ncbi:MAG: nitrite reductase, copper-containing [Polyangiaceae bacterium UTPRO1]|nr:MAG: nitrite reductase, copper-containing [Polyangiaceae bacterium UTPRO1]
MQLISRGETMQHRSLTKILARSLALVIWMLATTAGAEESLPVEKAIVTAPPNVPPPITRTTPARVVVELEVIEKPGMIADGVEYTFWTFGGTVPGGFIRVRVGDTVELHLANHPDNKLPHNIDLHAVTGPGGGAASTFTAPGHKSRFTFKALNPGLYIYHCATAPVGMHVANGMYGLIYVQSEKPLPPVDHEFYVVQGDFYTDQPFGVKGHQAFSMQRAIDEHPSYVVFNGSALSMVGDQALQAKVGDRIRIFVGNGGPNLVSSFHVIGEIFDTVYFEGGQKTQNDVQTTLIPAGGSAIVEFKLDTNGTYLLVDHSLLRTFNKGALAMLKAEGEQVAAIYSGKELDEMYLGDEAVASALRKKHPTPLAAKTAGAGAPDGRTLFANNCAMCHQAEGQGLEGVFPPLAKADYLMARATADDRSELVDIILNGKTGRITVNGNDYNAVMTPVSGLSDADIAAVLNFVTTSWGNTGARPFTTEEVAQGRAKIGSKAGAATP